MLLSVCITPSARADRAENAFVKVRAVGAGVTRVDGRNFSAQGDTEVEIEAHVSIDEGGLGDCYSAAGLRYHAELYFRDAYGESLSASDFVVDDDSREGAKAFALEIATAAINLEIQVGGAVEAAKRKFSEFKAKQVAGHNAAYRYHCTYQEGTNATPENCIHPAFQ